MSKDYGLWIFYVSLEVRSTGTNGIVEQLAIKSIRKGFQVTVIVKLFSSSDLLIILKELSEMSLQVFIVEYMLLNFRE